MPTHCCHRLLSVLVIPLLLAGLAGCTQAQRLGLIPPADIAAPGNATSPPPATPLPEPEPRLSGRAHPPLAPVGRSSHSLPAELPSPPPTVPAPSADANGDVTLNYVDADLREVVRAVLGSILRLNYTLDPQVRGTATLQTSRPLPRAALLPLLTGLLTQNGATLLVRDGVHAVVPAASALSLGAAARGGHEGSSTEVIVLRHASASDLAALLTPYVEPGGAVSADSRRNTLTLSGTPQGRRALGELIRLFDADHLAGLSFALYPVDNGSASQTAADLNRLLASEGKAMSGVRAVAVDQAGAVLAMARDPRTLERVGRLVRMVDRGVAENARAPHVYFLQNGQAADLAPLLQRAFGAPQDNVRSGGGLAPGLNAASLGSPSGGSGYSGAGGGHHGSSDNSSGGGGGKAGGAIDPAVTDALPDLFPMDEGSGGGGRRDPGLRIVAHPRNNALIVVATPAEYRRIEAAIRKLDVMPMQVVVEATIAEVTLNDTLRFGTQAFFKIGSSGLLLSDNNQTGPLSPSLPGFAYSFSGAQVQAALSALQSITDVKVVSSPKLVVLDNESARLQVGSQVPVTTQTARSIVTASAPVVSSVEYRETGVILTVAPRINTGGLVTLSIDQEVSDVVRTTSSGIDSPTIQQRRISSRVAVQDGETVVLGGLIRDSDTAGNQGLPVLGELPVVGFLFGTRSSVKARTELLVLLTPRIVRSPRDARALTEELRGKLGASARLLPPAATPRLR